MGPTSLLAGEVPGGGLLPGRRSSSDWQGSGGRGGWDPPVARRGRGRAARAGRQDGAGKGVGAVWVRAGGLHHHIAGRMDGALSALGEAALGDGRGGGFRAAFGKAYSAAEISRIMFIMENTTLSR
jgi:hypothetical protein